MPLNLGADYEVLGQRHLIGLPEWGSLGKPNSINRRHPPLHEAKLSSLEDDRACRVLSVFEAIVVVMLLPGLLFRLVVGKLLVSSREDIGSLSKFELGLPELVKGSSDLFSLLQCYLDSRCAPFHHV